MICPSGRAAARTDGDAEARSPRQRQPPETGNIILNSWVATIANLLKSALKMSLPIVVRGDGKHMFETSTSSLVLFLHIRFDIHQKAISGYVALIMDIPSLDELRSLIAAFIGSITRDESSQSRTERP